MYEGVEELRPSSRRSAGAPLTHQGNFPKVSRGVHFGNPRISTSFNHNGSSGTMSESQEILVTQIFFPRQIVSVDRPAFLIGWNTEQFQCTIAAAITLSYDMVRHLQRSNASILAEALRLCYEDPSFPLSVHHQCPFHPIVLGQWIPSGISGDFIPEADFQTRGIWVTLTKDTKSGMASSSSSSSTESSTSTVLLHSVYSLGSKYDTANYLVSYDMPNTDQLNSMNLIDPFSVHSYQPPTPSRPVPQSQSQSKHSSNPRNASHHRSQPTAYRSGSIFSSPKLRKPSIPQTATFKTSIWKDKSELELLIAQINASYDLQQITWFYLQQMFQQHVLQRSGIHVANTTGITNDMTSSWSTSASTASSASVHFQYWLQRGGKVLLHWMLLGPIYSYARCFLSLEHFLIKPLCFAKEVIEAWTWEQIAGSRVLQKHKPNLQHPATNTATTIPQAISTSTTPSGWNEDQYRYISISYVGNDLYFKGQKMLKLWKWIHLFVVGYHIDHILRSKAYLRIVNILFYVLVDVSLGLLVSYVLLQNVDYWIIQCLHHMFSYQFTYILPMIEGLHHAPLGIKLNTLITTKIGAMIEFVVHLCYLQPSLAATAAVAGAASLESVAAAGATTAATATAGTVATATATATTTMMIQSNAMLCVLMKLVFTLISLLGGLGITTQLAIISDLWTLFCLPLYCLHVASSYGIFWHARLLTSLWYLFYGQKMNILRNRVDSLEGYDQEVLVFGVIFFTIMLFLFPNFAAFYLLLGIIRTTALLINYMFWLIGMEVKYCPYNKFIFFALGRFYVFVSWIMKGAGRRVQRVVDFCWSRVTRGNRATFNAPASGASSAGASTSTTQSSNSFSRLGVLLNEGMLFVTSYWLWLQSLWNNLAFIQGMIDDGIDIKVQTISKSTFSSPATSNGAVAPFLNHVAVSSFDVGVESLIRDMSPKVRPSNESMFFFQDISNAEVKEADITMVDTRSEEVYDGQYLSASALKGHEGISQRSQTSNPRPASSSFWSSLRSSFIREDDENQSKSKFSNDAISESTENISVAQPEKVIMSSLPPPIKRVTTFTSTHSITYFHIYPTNRSMWSLVSRHNLWFAHFHRRNNLFLNVAYQFISAQPLRMHLPYLSKLLMDQVTTKEHRIMQHFLEYRLEHLPTHDQQVMKQLWFHNEHQEVASTYLEVFHGLLHLVDIATDHSPHQVPNPQTLKRFQSVTKTRYLVTLLCISTLFYGFQIMTTLLGMIFFAYYLSDSKSFMFQLPTET